MPACAGLLAKREADGKARGHDGLTNTKQARDWLLSFVSGDALACFLATLVRLKIAKLDVPAAKAALKVADAGLKEARVAADAVAVELEEAKTHVAKLKLQEAASQAKAKLDEAEKKQAAAQKKVDNNVQDNVQVGATEGRPLVWDTKTSTHGDAVRRTWKVQAEPDAAQVAVTNTDAVAQTEFVHYIQPEGDADKGSMGIVQFTQPANVDRKKAAEARNKKLGAAAAKEEEARAKARAKAEEDKKNAEQARAAAKAKAQQEYDARLAREAKEHEESRELAKAQALVIAKLTAGANEYNAQLDAAQANGDTATLEQLRKKGPPVLSAKDQEVLSQGKDNWQAGQCKGRQNNTVRGGWFS